MVVVVVVCDPSMTRMRLDKPVWLWYNYLVAKRHPSQFPPQTNNRIGIIISRRNIVSEVINFNPSEASKGAFSAVQKIEGALVSHTRKPSRFKNADGSPQNDQIEVKLKDVIILEMADNEPEPELRDNEFTFWVTYAAPGKDKAGANTFWIKGYCASAIKEYGKTPNELESQRVVLEKREVYLFTIEDRNTGEKEDRMGTNFIFVNPAAEENKVDVDAKVKALVAGKTPAAAMRELMLDSVTARHKDIQAAARAGKLGEVVSGVSIVDGVYVVETADA